MKKKYGTIVKYVALGLMILIFNIFVNSDMLIKNNVEYINLNNSANLYYNEKLVQVGNINKYYIKDAQYGDSIRIEKRIGSKKIVNPVIVFDNIYNLGYEVRINGKKITQKGMDAKKDSVVCNDFISIPVDDIEDKKLEIIFKVVNGKGFNRVPQLKCFNGLELGNIFFKSTIDYFLIAMVMIEIGLLMLVFMVVNFMLKVFSIKNVYTSFICIFAGTWILSCFQVDSFLISSKQLDFYMEHISFSLTLIFGNLYLQELYKEEKIAKIILKVLNVILILSVVSIILLQVFDIIFIGDTLIAVTFHAVPLLVFAINKFIVGIKEKIGVHKTVVLIAILAVFAAIYIGLVETSEINDKGILNVAILVYIVVIFLTINQVIAEMNEAYITHAEKKGLSKLAYLDALTGISNRRGMDKYINGIEEHKEQRKYKVCSYDLNRLKYINDTYGHAAGDDLLKDFANALKHCLNGDFEYCGRIGGDEFIVIVLEERVNEYVKSLRKYIKERNKTGEHKYEVSYCFGMADYESFSGKDINDSIRAADFEMYEMKTAYKMKHGLEYMKDDRSFN